MREKLGDYTASLRAYVREARSFGDVVRLLRVRLSQSRVGPLVCRTPTTVTVDTEHLGLSVRLRSHTTDIVVFNEIIVGRSYEPLARAAGSSVSTLVDLGACTGLASRWFLERFPSACLVAVEPSPGNASVLRTNLRPYAARARVVQACIGATSRQVVLVGDREDGFRMREPDGVEGDTDVVTMSRVFDELGSYRIYVLKVDIEGAEQELFEACGEWIGRVGLVSVECHHPFTGEMLVGLLKRNGVRPRVLHVGTGGPQYEWVLVRIETEQP